MYNTASEIPQGLHPLLDIDVVKKMSIDDKPLIDELTQVLAKYDALNRFGITLLHQHFQIQPDEILLEETDVRNRVQTIRPVSKAIVDKLRTVNTQWRLDAGTAVQVCCCGVDADNSHTGHSGSLDI